MDSYRGPLGGGRDSHSKQRRGLADRPRPRALVSTASHDAAVHDPPSHRPHVPDSQMRAESKWIAPGSRVRRYAVISHGSRQTATARLALPGAGNAGSCSLNHVFRHSC